MHCHCSARPALSHVGCSHPWLTSMQFTSCECLNACVHTDFFITLSWWAALLVPFIGVFPPFLSTYISGLYLLDRLSSWVNKRCIPAVSMSACVPAHCNLSLIVSLSGGIGWGCVIASNWSLRHSAELYIHPFTAPLVWNFWMLQISYSCFMLSVMVNVIACFLTEALFTLK